MSGPGGLYEARQGTRNVRGMYAEHGMSGARDTLSERGDGG